MRVHNDLKRWLRGCVLVVGWTCFACSESHDVARDGFSLMAGSGATAPEGRGGGGAGGAGGQTPGGATIGKCTGCVAGNVLGFLQLPACCTESNQCGLDLSALDMTAGCAPVMAPGSASAECPSQTVLGFVTLEGCCRPDKICGALDTLTGLLGCFAGADTSMAKTCTP